MYGQHIPIYYDNLKKKALTRFTLPDLKIDGITINPQELRILANSHHSTSIPPMCIWYSNCIVLTTIRKNLNLGFMIIPRNPSLFDVEFLTRSHTPTTHICSEKEGTYGRFLKYKGCSRGGCRNLQHIINTHIIKQSVDGVCDGVCWYDDENKKYKLQLLLHIRRNIRHSQIPPMCVWTKHSILLLSQSKDNTYYIYKIPRDPFDFKPDYIKIIKT